MRVYRVLIRSSPARSIHDCTAAPNRLDPATHHEPSLESLNSLFQQINTNASQGNNSPRRYGFSCTEPLPEPSSQELRIALFHDGMARITHQLHQVVHIIHRHVVSTDGLFTSDMVDESSRDTHAFARWMTSRQTTRTDTIRAHRPKVSGLSRVAHRYCASGGNGLTGACDAGWPDAVEHVGTEGDGNEKVFWVALAKLGLWDVAGSMRR